MFVIFPGHPQAFGFWASSTPDNRSLNPANKRNDHCLSHVQTVIGAAAHATIETEQLISHTTTAFIDNIAFLKDSESGVIPVSGVHEILITIHDSLDNVVA